MKSKDVSQWIDEPDCFEAALIAVCVMVMINQPDASLEKCREQLRLLRRRIDAHFDR
jgi:hypothetical protein